MATGDAGGFTSLGVDADIARDLYTELSSKLAAARVANQPMVKQFSTVIKSNSKTQRFNFAHSLAQVREFLGERVFEKISSMDYSLSNKDWESSWEWKREDLADDLVGSLRLGIDESVTAIIEHPDSMWTEFLNHQIAGTATVYGTGFDGKVLFSATHAWPAGYTTAQSNLFSGTNTGKLDLTYGYDNLQAAYQKLTDGFFWPNSDGVTGRIKSKPTHLFCSSSVFFNAQRLLDSQKVVSGSTATYGLPDANVINKLGLTIVLVPGLTAGYWIMADMSKGVGPWLWQERQEIEMEFQGPGSDVWFNNRMARAGAFARYMIGQGMFYRAVAGDGT